MHACVCRPITHSPWRTTSEWHGDKGCQRVMWETLAEQCSLVFISCSAELAEQPNCNSAAKMRLQEKCYIIGSLLRGEDGCPPFIVIVCCPSWLTCCHSLAWRENCCGQVRRYQKGAPIYFSAAFLGGTLLAFPAMLAWGKLARV